MNALKNTTHGFGGNQLTEQELNHIRESLQGLRFGSILITVQDGVIVQIERTEKRRLVNSRKQVRPNGTPGDNSD